MSADTASVVGRPKLRLPDSEKACPDNFRNFRIVIQSASQTAAEPRRSFFEAFYVDLSMKVGQEKRPESLEQMAGHPVLSQSPQRSEMGFVPGILSVHHPLQHPIPFLLFIFVRVFVARPALVYRSCFRCPSCLIGIDVLIVAAFILAPRDGAHRSPMEATIAPSIFNCLLVAFRSRLRVRNFNPDRSPRLTGLGMRGRSYPAFKRTSRPQCHNVLCTKSSNGKPSGLLMLPPRLQGVCRKIDVEWTRHVDPGGSRLPEA
ncbi:hypothetical protein KC320_g34 [Hortaea werneckii]|nr:hypothetical protein KC320_g34 [Hortaea werneckii]